MTAAESLIIRLLEAGDIDEIADAFAALGWDKPASQYGSYLADQEAGRRVALVAFVKAAFAGYVTVVWRSEYAPFAAADIPEIQDFNVLPHLRRQGIGTALLDEAERRIAERSPVAGIGVGLTPDYGAAQRLYVKRGYIPDGRGLTSGGEPVSYGQPLTADDDLVLYFTKELHRHRKSSDGESRPHFEIRPGESIGPFRLGMTVAEAQSAARSLGVTVSVPKQDEDTLAIEPLALTLRFDAQGVGGRCQEIEARIFGRNTPVFLLGGSVVNDISDEEARSLLRSFFPFHEFPGGAASLPEAGIRTLKWEASDDFPFAVCVMPRHAGNRA